MKVISTLYVCMLCITIQEAAATNAIMTGSCI